MSSISSSKNVLRLLVPLYWSQYVRYIVDWQHNNMPLARLALKFIDKFCFSSLLSHSIQVSTQWYTRIEKLITGDFQNSIQSSKLKWFFFLRKVVKFHNFAVGFVALYFSLRLNSNNFGAPRLHAMKPKARLDWVEHQQQLLTRQCVYWAGYWNLKLSMDLSKCMEIFSIH